MFCRNSGGLGLGRGGEKQFNTDSSLANLHEKPTADYKDTPGYNRRSKIATQRGNNTKLPELDGPLARNRILRSSKWLHADNMPQIQEL